MNDDSIKARGKIPSQTQLEMNFTADVQEHPVITVAYVNCRGQTGFNVSKQLQIENYLQTFSIDILHLQESRIDADTFTQCNFLSSNYSVLQNNSHNQYGTASLVKNSLTPERNPFT